MPPSMLVSNLRGLRRQNALRHAIQELAVWPRPVTCLPTSTTLRASPSGPGWPEPPGACARAGRGDLLRSPGASPTASTKRARTQRRSAWPSTPSSHGARLPRRRCGPSGARGIPPSPTARGRTSRRCTGSTCTRRPPQLQRAPARRRLRPLRDKYGAGQDVGRRAVGEAPGCSDEARPPRTVNLRRKPRNRACWWSSFSVV